MTPNRNRTFRASASLLTALSLGLTALAGCASFDPNPTTAVPPAATGVQPAATTPTAATAVPVAAMSQISGVADLGGVPMANARIEVYNALTDEPITGLVAAGAGNIVAAGAGNYGLKQAPELKTDAQGKFNFSMPEVGPEDVFRVVILDAEDTPVTIVVGGSELTPEPGAYALAQTATTTPKFTKRTTFNLQVDLSSTLASPAFKSALKMVKALKSRGNSVGESVAMVLDNLRSAEKQFRKSLIARGFDNSRAKALAKRHADRIRNGLMDYGDLDKALQDAGLGGTLNADEMINLLSDTLTKLLTVAATTKGFDGTLNLTANDFPSSLNVDLSKISQGTITFTKPDGTEEVITGVKPTEVVDTIVVEDDPNDGDATPGSPKHFPASGSTFAPTIKIEGTGGASDTTITVGQATGEDDVQLIIARISKALTGADFVEGNMNGTNAGMTSNHPLVAAGTMAPTTTGALAPKSYNISSRMGKITLTGATYNGVLKDNNGAGQTIAQVQVFETPEFVYLALEYQLPTGVTVTNGHSTVLTLKAAALPLTDTLVSDNKASANGTVNIDLYSRKGSYSEYNENIQALAL